MQPTIAPWVAVLVIATAGFALFSLAFMILTVAESIWVLAAAVVAAL